MALIFEATSSGTADVRVFVTEQQGLADLLVWHTNEQGAARGDDGAWCYVEHSGLASSRVWFVDSRGNADLTICLVSSRGLSGWRGSHALMGRL